MRRKTLVTIAAVMFGLCAAVWKACDAVRKEMCWNTVLNETLSPDRQYRLVSFERDCGAVSDFSTQVSILEAGEPLPNDAGNVFIASTDHGIAPSGPGGGPEVRVTWTGTRTALIERHWKARVFKAEPRVGEVRFTITATLKSLPADAGTKSADAAVGPE